MDPQEHDRIDELLAGYALRSLTGEDAAEADRLLSQHVPDCARCRETLLALSDTVADLALAAEPIAPPETLLPRLHRELEPRGSAPRGRAAGRRRGRRRRGPHRRRDRRLAGPPRRRPAGPERPVRAGPAILPASQRRQRPPGRRRCRGPGAGLGGRGARRRPLLPGRQRRAGRLRRGWPTASGSPTAWRPSSPGPSSRPRGDGGQGAVRSIAVRPRPDHVGDEGTVPTQPGEAVWEAAA